MREQKWLLAKSFYKNPCYTVPICSLSTKRTGTSTCLLAVAFRINNSIMLVLHSGNFEKSMTFLTSLMNWPSRLMSKCIKLGTKKHPFIIAPDDWHENGLPYAAFCKCVRCSLIERSTMFFDYFANTPGDSLVCQSCHFKTILHYSIIPILRQAEKQGIYKEWDADLI